MVEDNMIEDDDMYVLQTLIQKRQKGQSQGYIYIGHRKMYDIYEDKITDFPGGYNQRKQKNENKRPSV